MAGKRFVEVIFRLKDLFSRQSKKITGAYDDITRSANRAEDRVTKSSSAIGRTFAAIGSRITAVFAGAGFVGAFAKLQAFTREVDELAETAQKLGTTTEELSKLGFAAELSGVSLQTLTLGMQRATRRISEAAQGAGEAQGALRELGLDARELAKLTPDEQFRRLADAFETVGSQADRVRLGFKLFDSEGVAIINTLEGGSAALDRFGDELERAGNVISSETADAVQEFNDNLVRLRNNVDGLANQTLPTLVNIANAIFEFARITETTDTLSSDIADLEAELAKLEKRDFGAYVRSFGQGFKDIETNIDRLTEVIAEKRGRLIDLENLEEVERIRKENEADTTAHNRYMAALEKERTKVLAEEKRKQVAAERQALNERKRIQAETARIEKEFEELVKGPAEAIDESQPLDLIDLAKPISDAMRAFAEGDFDKAVEDSRRAGELLNVMREQGEYADIVLTGMAQRIRDIAVEAAQAREKSKIEVEVDDRSIEELERRIEELKRGVIVPVRFEESTGAGDLAREADKRGAKL